MANGLTTKFLILELPQPDDPSQLILLISQELTKMGSPLRWAITELPKPGRMRIEAVVTSIEICPENL